MKPQKLASGSYRVRLYTGTDEDGKKIYKSFTHKDKDVVVAMAMTYKSKNKRNKKNKSVLPDELTVRQAIAKYISSKEKILSPSTVRGYNIHLRNYLKSIMELPLSSLTSEAVQKAINFEVQQGHSSKTIKNAYGLLTATLKKYAPELQLYCSLPQKTKKDMYIPTKEDIRVIQKAVLDTNMELPFCLSIYLGLRRSELCALTWNDIDFKNKTVRINKAMVITKDGDYTVKPPKTQAGYRTISIPDKCLEVLKKYKKKSGYITDLKSDTIATKFNRILKRLNMPHFRWHDLRHYTASVMLALNIPTKYAQEIMGHETDNMLKNVYQHTMSEEMKKISEKINVFFEEN